MDSSSFAPVVRWFMHEIGKKRMDVFRGSRDHVCVSLSESIMSLGCVPSLEVDGTIYNVNGDTNVWINKKDNEYMCAILGIRQ